MCVCVFRLSVLCVCVYVQSCLVYTRTAPLTVLCAAIIRCYVAAAALAATAAAAVSVAGWARMLYFLCARCVCVCVQTPPRVHAYTHSTHSTHSVRVTNQSTSFNMQIVCFHHIECKYMFCTLQHTQADTLMQKGIPCVCVCVCECREVGGI